MRRLFGTVFATTLTLSLATPLAAQGVSGDYLAGRAASMQNDFSEAAQYFARASAVDADNASILESAVIAYMALGQFNMAAPLSRKLDQLRPGNQVAAMALTTQALGQGVTPALSAKLAGGNQIGPLIDTLLYAWSELSLGRIGPAFEAFDAMIAQDEYQNFGFYHKGLALAMVGDYETAAAILSGRSAGEISQTRRGVLALAQILGQLGQLEAAMELLAGNFDLSDPVIGRLHGRLAAGKPVPFDIVPDAKAGISEAFYSLAIALNGQADDSYTLLYARIASHLDRRNTDALLLSANLLDQMKQFDLANAAYNAVPRDHPAFLAAELGRAEALRSAEKPDAGIEVLTQLTETHPDVPVVFTSLGDILRQNEKFEAAVGAYSQSIALRSERTEDQWFVYYVRGIAHERIGNWPAAEADFRTSLELRPNQPNVLNYLGYSLVEKREKLDEALDMIRRAVQARPESGYITDSLGWVLYRLGRFDEAVAPMERAAALEAVDPVVNDHLGDVYWAVGRTREAEFQWRRALSFIDAGITVGEADPDRIRRKLEVGLDKVLAEEGAPSLAQTAADAAAGATHPADDG